MNYESMSNGQINEAVTTKLSSNSPNTPSVFDFCHGWAYGGLIIQKAKISLIKTDDNCWTAFEWENDENESWHKNPLRAAMIVYLEMNKDK